MPETTDDLPGPPAVGLTGIFLAFLRLGGTSVGGGTAGWLYREIVQRRGWIDDRTFLADFALGQALPGSNGVKLTVQIGLRLHGAAGAAAALLGLLAVPFAIVLALGSAYSGLAEHGVVRAMLEGVAAAVIGLTLATGLRSTMEGGPDAVGLAITAATVLAVGIFSWPILPVVAVLAPLGIARALLGRPRR